MVHTAKDSLMRLLTGAPVATSDSATMNLPAGSLEMHVQGVGDLSLPVRAPQAKKLLAVARPAHFGKGEETLLDPSVRDTWEITPAQVTLGGERWQATLDGALAHLGAEIGIPPSTRLRAELHSMLVYGKGQFFAAHQDSEKHDDMVATLVVVLPSTHTGGQLVVHTRDGRKEYAAARQELSLVAFYPDQRHEVLPVRSGHRITLTFNVLSEEVPDIEIDGPVGEAAAWLRAHFRAPIPSAYGTSATPERLALLLDHEYSRRGLSARRLKGEDARRVALLEVAAQEAGCEWALAQAQIHETWNAAVEAPFYHHDYAYYNDYGDYGDDVDGGEDGGDPGGDGDDEPGLASLIADTVVLTWWADAQSQGETNLPLRTDEVCAVTPTVDLEPYDSEHQGFMGNYGNTVDRWYRRAALVLWPREQGFATRAEARPGWALDTILASLAGGELGRARAQTRVLAEVWGSSAQAGLLAPALRVAAGVEDADLALAVLAPFSVQGLGVDHAALLGDLARVYPRDWWSRLRDSWDSGSGFGRFGERHTWVETALVPVCRELDSVGAPELVAWLGGWMADRLVQAVASTLHIERVAQREQWLGGLGPSLAAVLAVADDQRGTAVVEELRGRGDVVLPLLVSALRAHEPPVNTAMIALAEHLRDRLTAFLGRPARGADDWSIAWASPGGQDADRLAAFLRSATERTLDWPLAEPRRQSIHRLIDDAALPVRHTTRRTGRPYTLVLHKTDDLFTGEQAARERAEEDLAMVRRVIDLVR